MKVGPRPRVGGSTIPSRLKMDGSVLPPYPQLIITNRESPPYCSKGTHLNAVKNLLCCKGIIYFKGYRENNLFMHAGFMPTILIGYRPLPE